MPLVNLIWSIKNLDFCGNNKLCSPMMCVGCYNFQLVLNTQAGLSNDTVHISLSRLKDAGAEIVTVKYEIALVGIPKHCSKISQFEHELKKNECWIKKCNFLKKKVFSKMFLQEDVITFQCNINSVTALGSSNLDVFDFECLSHSLGVMFETGEYSDITLIAEGQKFYVHRVVLKSRCPVLYNYLEDMGQLSEFVIEGVKASSLKVILHFLYTGFFIFKNLTQDMMMLLDRFYLVDLKHHLWLTTHSPQTVKAESKITFLKTSFKWKIENFSQLNSTDLCCYPVCFVVENFCCKIHVVFAISSGTYVEFRFQNEKDLDVGFVDYKLTLEKNSKNKKSIEGHYYTSDLSCIEKLKFQELVDFTVDDCLNICCELKLYSKKSTTEVQVIVDPQKRKKQTGDQNVITNLEQLQRDFYDIVTKKQHLELSDVALWAGHVKFLVHKVFLCSRSQVFARMFENNFLEKRENFVIIEDVSPEVLSSVIQYIYSGCTNKMSIREAMRLYAAADKYELLTLKEKCFETIQRLFSGEYSGEVLELSDRHADEKMKAFVYDYITKNPRKALETKGLSSLDRTFGGYQELLETLLERIDQCQEKGSKSSAG